MRGIGIEGGLMGLADVTHLALSNGSTAR